jgi:flagellar hook assembly protein FlgD
VELSPVAGNWIGRNRPNPFNPVTEIPFRIESSGPVRAQIFSIEGRLVRTILDGWALAGDHRLVWDGLGASGKPMASGVYLLKVRYPTGDTGVLKLSLLR